MWSIVVHLCCLSVYVCSAGTPPPPAFYMTANGAVITEHRHDHHSHEGEPTNFTCHGDANVYIMYQPNGEEAVPASPLAAADAHVYMKLSARDNNTLLTCYLGIDEPNVIILRLIVKPPDNNTDIIGFKVNGLTTSAAWNGGGWEHEYTYFSGEPLLVEVATGGRQYGDVTCRFEGTNVPSNLTTDNIGKYWTPLQNIFKVILYEKQSDTFVNCTASRLADAVLFRSSIKFTLYNDPAYDPYIIGLSFARILMQYDSRGTNVIYYEYMGNDTVTLTLISKHPPMPWEYNPNDVITDYKQPADDCSITFQLHPDANSTIIKYPGPLQEVRMTFIRTEAEGTAAPAAAALVDLAELISAEKRKLGYVSSGVAAAVVGVVAAALITLKFLGKRIATQAASADTAMGDIQHQDKPRVEQNEMNRQAASDNIAEQGNH